MGFHASLPALGNGNPELDTESLTQVVREVLEEVLKGRIKGTRDTLQDRCMDCGKKKGHSSLRKLTLRLSSSTTK
ncbi:hypothetical protein J1N35_022752 [Gossypium stocksii]|uniref:Uncharacterized protein n=1 Tax=Gossypium stocksii TaxID=47602 RepID=A0A9D3VHC4_9ROSI|nr:hypothetical protein J1N35_022752 [Gossypium stocksii]